MVVIVTGYALFVTSHSEVILTFPNQRFSEVCCHNLYIILHALLSCKDARKLMFVIMWLLHVQLLKGQNRFGLVRAVTINPPELPIIDEARNDAHIASTGVRLY